MSFKTFVLELTQQCNNRCLYCYNPWRAPDSNYPSGQLTTEETKAIITKLKKETAVESIGISGGEPFLHPDIGEIVSFIRQKNIHPVIITNGTLLTQTNIEKTKDAASYEVTLLSYKKEVHNHLVQNEAFQKVIEGITNLDEQKGNFIAAFVATKLNSPDLYKTAELAIALGAVGLMYNRMNLSANNIQYGKELAPTPSMIKNNLDELQKLNEKYGIPIASSVPIPPCVVETKEYRNIKFSTCPRGGKDSYFTVDSSGKLKVCNHSPKILGDFKTEPFAELMKHPYVQEFKSSLPDECKNCKDEWKNSCFGGCRSASEACYGNLSSIDPFVHLSKQ